MYIGGTLGSTGGAGIVPVRIFNTSDKAQIMSAQTVVAVAKPVTSVAGLEIPDQIPDCFKSAAHKIHGGEDQIKETSPDPLKA